MVGRAAALPRCQGAKTQIQNGYPSLLPAGRRKINMRSSMRLLHRPILDNACTLTQVLLDVKYESLRIVMDVDAE